MSDHEQQVPWNFVGIDPGVGGGIAVLTNLGAVVTLKLKDATERDIYEFLRSVDARHARAVIERVSSSPQQGVVSAFTFARGYGFLRGALTGCGIPFVEVTPQKWQKHLNCLSKGDKNVTKARAQQLYPQEKISHANADALLIATYCRQNHAQLF